MQESSKWGAESLFLTPSHSSRKASGELGELRTMVVLSILSSEGGGMGPCGRGPKWAVEMTVVAVDREDFIMGGVRDRVSPVCGIPAHAHLDAFKEGQVPT